MSDHDKAEEETVKTDTLILTDPGRLSKVDLKEFTKDFRESLHMTPEEFARSLPKATPEAMGAMIKMAKNFGICLADTALEKQAYEEMITIGLLHASP